MTQKVLIYCPHTSCFAWSENFKASILRSFCQDMVALMLYGSFVFRPSDACANILLAATVLSDWCAKYLFLYSRYATRLQLTQKNTGFPFSVQLHLLQITQKILFGLSSGCLCGICWGAEPSYFPFCLPCDIWDDHCVFSAASDIFSPLCAAILIRTFYVISLHVYRGSFFPCSVFCSHLCGR